MSPTKQMVENSDDFEPNGMPALLTYTEQLKQMMEQCSFDELKNIYRCSDKIVAQNVERWQRMSLTEHLTPALFAYKGLAFQHVAPGAMDEEQLSYVQNHLCILSGFYGVVKPFDGITSYRLEMQNVLPNGTDLYSFWGDVIYQTINDKCIINLASKEYSDVITPYLKEDDRMITIVFGEMKNGKVITKGTKAKMARGDMVFWLSQNNIEDPEQIKQYNEGYAYEESLSNASTFVFIETV